MTLVDPADRFRAPNTMTRAEWEKMRVALPDKIDEVMASFRDQKIEVSDPLTRGDDDTSWLFEEPEEPRSYLRIFLLGMLIGVAMLAAMFFWMQHKNREIAQEGLAEPIPLQSTPDVSTNTFEQPKSEQGSVPAPDVQPSRAGVGEDPLQPLFKPGVARSRAELKAPEKRPQRKHNAQEEIDLTTPAGVAGNGQASE
ncbi:hypothetical protein KSF73_13025 [Burkholderiaceae bacterium DAT-1]|nr:hypothetical protein [Burkholderiaceae bacterium DAT-1]